MKPRFNILFTVALPLAFATYTQAQIFNNATADGLAWGTAGNWTPATVPNAIDAEAIVNGAEPLGATPATLALDVLMDGNYTVGKFTRSVNGGQPATFPSTPVAGDVTKGLTLQKSSGTPEVSVVGDVFFYSAIFGTQGFEKTGAGRFTFRFNGTNQTYTGPVKISAGTLGIEKDRSLGDVGNSIEISNGAKLFAEPGSNAGTITLPATRAITLGGAFPQIGAANANVNLVIAGNISDGGNVYGLDKTDGGVVTLAGTNTWTGAAGASAGILTATMPAALPGYGSQAYFVNGTSTLAVRHGDGTPSWTTTEIAGLLGNGNLSYEANASFGIDTTGNTSDTVYAANLANDLGISRFTKVGPGKLTLSNAPDLSRITVFEGTLALGLASQPASGVALLFTKSGGTLDLGTLTVDGVSLAYVNGGTTTITNGVLGLPATVSFNVTAANTILSLPSAALTIGRVQPFSGNTTTINGAGGSLTVNGDFNFDVNGNTNTRLTMSGLSSFTYDRPNKAFRSIPICPTTASGTSNNELLLAATGTGSNLIKAAAVSIGAATGASNGAANQGQLRLGTTNEFRTPVFTLGGFNGSGVVTFQAGLTSPTFKVRDADGTSAIPLLRIGETSSGVRSGAGTLDLTGGSGDILATGIVIGRHIVNTNNGFTSELILPAGSVTANNMILTEKVNGGIATSIGNVTQQDGSVTVDSITLAQVGFGSVAPQNIRANYNLNGGTLTAGNINGFSQVETATGVGVITTAGDLSVTVTGADLPVSPLIVSVPVLTADNTADKWIVKVANALNANAAISSKFIAATSGANVFLTRRAGGSVDATLNIALANGTAVGITEAPTSVDTTTSVLVSNIQRNLILKGGTLVNKPGADLSISGVTITVSGVTTTTVDSTVGRKVILAGDVTYSARMNSSAPSAGMLTVDGDLDLGASPVFAIVDDAAVDATLLPGGTELVLIDYQNGSLTGTFAGLADGATVSVTKGTVTNEFVIDYNDPDHGGKAVTLTVPSVGGNYASWANDPLKGNIPGEPVGGDFDNDGLSNLVEYALGKNPRVSSQPAGALLGNTVTFTKGIDAIANSDVSWVIETSATLEAGSWTPQVTQAPGEASAEIAFTFAPPVPTKNFARLKVTQLP